MPQFTLKSVRRALPTVALLFGLSLAAHAQIGVYGTLVASKVNNPTSAQAASFGGTNTGYWSTGFGGGVYYDAWHLGPVSLGLDARGSGASQAKIGLFGIRVAGHPPILPIKPYVEVLGGVQNTTNIYNVKVTDFVYEFVGGVDYTIIPHFDFRVIEVGGGQIPTGISTAPTGTRSLVTVSTGLAFHF